MCIAALRVGQLGGRSMCSTQQVCGWVMRVECAHSGTRARKIVSVWRCALLCLCEPVCAYVCLHINIPLAGSRLRE